MTNSARFLPYDGKACRAQLDKDIGYSFTFGTADSLAFGLGASVKQLNEGFHYNLAALRAISPVGEESAGMQILRDISTLRDEVVIQFDQGTNELIGYVR